MNGISIVIPAYNEENGIGSVLEQLIAAMDASGLAYEIIVVDDGSTDHTAKVVAAHSGVRLIHHETNRGYGAALKTGIRRARCDVVVITDADDTYPAQAIPELAHNCEEYDMVVGARLGKEVRIPLARKPAKWCLTRLANYLTGIRIPDLNSGLRAMKRDVVMSFFSMLPSGFSFTTTITLALLTNDFNVKFMPINYQQRVGHSKIRPFHDTLNFVSLITRTVLFFDPLRVLLPVGAFLMLLSLAKYGFDLYRYRDFHITGTTIVMMMTAIQVTVLAFVADLIAAQRKT
jgi:glycosyltransferase involved in cell wall biosynthesis